MSPSPTVSTRSPKELVTPMDSCASPEAFKKLPESEKNAMYARLSAHYAALQERADDTTSAHEYLKYEAATSTARLADQVQRVKRLEASTSRLREYTLALQKQSRDLRTMLKTLLNDNTRLRVATGTAHPLAPLANATMQEKTAVYRQNECVRKMYAAQAVQRVRPSPRATHKPSGHTTSDPRAQLSLPSVERRSPEVVDLTADESYPRC